MWRIAAMTTGLICCPRCHREVDPWPLKRADICSPKDWAYCIRQMDNVLAQLAEAAVVPMERQGHGGVDEDLRLDDGSSPSIGRRHASTRARLVSRPARIRSATSATDSS
jgi:hypothetical protein